MPPRLSVVIASVNGSDELVECRAAFYVQPESRDVEIIVADCCAGGTAESIRRRFPDVRQFHFDERKTIPELRAVGILNARGEIVAMTEDHCRAARDWIASVLEAHRSGHQAIGGPVENAATDRTVDWAVYFCEYGRFMSPVTAGPTDDLPGPNVSYKRAALAHFRDLVEAATWEPFWHWRLVRRGVALALDPRMVIYHHKHFTFREFWKERYHYARSFAGKRIEGASMARRVLSVAGSPLIPPLMIYRLIRHVWPKHRHRGRLLQSLPYILLFTISWAAGEIVGYAWGPGHSLERIE